MYRQRGLCASARCTKLVRILPHTRATITWLYVLVVLSDEAALNVFPPPDLLGVTNCTGQLTEATLAKRCCALAPPTTASASARLRLHPAISSSAYEDIWIAVQPGQLQKNCLHQQYMISPGRNLVANHICTFRKWQIHSRSSQVQSAL